MASFYLKSNFLDGGGEGFIGSKYPHPLATLGYLQKNLNL